MDKQISRYFTWREALLLPKWGRLANQSDGLNLKIEAHLVDLFTRMDKVREYFQLPVNVHCAYRPVEYNKEIGGAIHSAHIDGMAVDFDVKGLECREAVSLILRDDMLEDWDMRMEDNGDHAPWIHLDIRAPSDAYSRYFKP